MIAIINYGMGNIHSVGKVIEALGLKYRVSATSKDLRNAQKIILPGVGAFSEAMKELERRGLRQEIISQVREKKPFLGICLGMQLLFEHSPEGAGTPGLGILT